MSRRAAATTAATAAALASAFGGARAHGRGDGGLNHVHLHRSRAWTATDAAHATLASLVVSLASLCGCALMAIGARASALAWLSDAAIGAMLADALGCQLPSALDAARRARGEDGAVVAACATIAGILVFHRLEAIASAAKARREEDGGARRGRRATSRGRGSSARARERRAAARTISTSGWLNLYADAVHNFTDGVVIAIAFARRGVSRGYAAAWTTLAHELPQELGDYGILRRSGFTDAEALGFNFLSALVAVAATALTFVVLAALDAASASASARSAVVARLALDVPYCVEAFCAGGFLTVAFTALREDASKSPKRSSLALLRAFAAAVLVAALHRHH